MTATSTCINCGTTVPAEYDACQACVGAKYEQRQTPARNLFPGDTILYDPIGNLDLDNTAHTVHRVITERDGRITLVVEAMGQRPRSLTMAPETKLTRIY